MNRSPLLTELLNNLRPQEREAARHWLNCPLHNTRKDLVTLFDYLVDMQYNLSIQVTPEAAFKKVYPNRDFNPASWTKTLHQLLSCLEDFLVHQQLQQSPFFSRQTLYRVYQQRGLARHLQTRINRNRKPRVGTKEWAGMERFWHDYALEREAYRLNAIKRRTQKHNLPAQEQSLLAAFLAVKLRQTCETLAHLRLFHSDFQPPWLEESLALAEQTPFRDEPGIRLFYLGAQLYRQTDLEALDQLFDELRSGIDLYINQFPAEDQRNLIVLGINHCLRQSNAGRKQYLRQTLNLYQLGLEKKLLYDSGQIGIFTFNNIIGVALRLGENDWAEAFLETNARRLPTDDRGEVESLNRARLAFQRRDYPRTLELLQTADYRDFIHHMTGRVMQLKIFFERDDYNLLTSHIRSTRSLIKRRKNLGYHQRNYLNIINLTEKLLRLPPGDKKAQSNLRRQIQDTDPCTEKPWLLSQFPMEV